MSLTEIREMNISDLTKRAKDLGEELFKLRLQHSIRPLENTARISHLKTKVAQINTVISEKKKA